MKPRANRQNVRERALLLIEKGRKMLRNSKMSRETQEITMMIEKPKAFFEVKNRLLFARVLEKARADRKKIKELEAQIKAQL
jgi:hypothetical protein